MIGDGAADVPRRQAFDAHDVGEEADQLEGSRRRAHRRARAGWGRHRTGAAGDASTCLRTSRTAPRRSRSRRRYRGCPRQRSRVGGPVAGIVRRLTAAGLRRGTSTWQPACSSRRIAAKPTVGRCRSDQAGDEQRDARFAWMACQTHGQTVLHVSAPRRGVGARSRHSADRGRCRCLSRASSSAATVVVPVPMNGSSTSGIGAAMQRMHQRGRSTGNVLGWWNFAALLCTVSYRNEPGVAAAAQVRGVATTGDVRLVLERHADRQPVELHVARRRVRWKMCSWLWCRKRWPPTGLKCPTESLPVAIDLIQVMWFCSTNSGAQPHDQFERQPGRARRAGNVEEERARRASSPAAARPRPATIQSRYSPPAAVLVGWRSADRGCTAAT